MSIACLAVAVASLAHPAQPQQPPATFHVAQSGDDSWSGRLPQPTADGTDGPFATVRRAQQAARAERADAVPAAPVVVEIGAGTFFLTEALVLTPDDSGIEAVPTIYRAAAKQHPVLSGGVQITGFSIGDDGAWHARVPEGIEPTQLFMNDQRRFRPRLPVDGYFAIERQVEPSERHRDKGHDRFGFAAGDLDPDWHDLGAVEVLAFHLWSASRMRIAAIDREQRVVTFTGRTRTAQRWGQFPKGHRYLAINVRQALRAPGQWYFDRTTRELTYLPRDGEDPATTTVITPRLTTLVLLLGDPETGRCVEHVQLQGLTFAHAAWKLAAEGQSYPQAEVQLGAAVALRGARHCALERCTVRHVGGYALELGAACQHDSVRACALVDLGGGGIKIGAGGGGGSWPTGGEGNWSGESSSVQHIAVEDCLIAHGGRLHPAAVGVWIGHASHCRIAYNTVRDFYYTGISVGWSWGYHDTRSHHNEIAHNHIHAIGQGVLSDLAGVYTLGMSPGTTVHHNRIHDVQSFDYGGWGLYTDEGSTGIVMDSNVVFRTKTGSFHQHYGRDNIVRNNILAHSERWQVQRTRAEDHRSFVFERNIVCWNGGPLLHGNWGGAGFRLDRNLYWNEAGPVLFPGELTLDQWRSRRGQDGGSAIGDPGFVASDQDDFRLRPDSPALTLGFVPFDPGDNGTRVSPARTAQLPPVPPAYR